MRVFFLFLGAAGFFLVLGGVGRVEIDPTDAGLFQGMLIAFLGIVLMAAAIFGCRTKKRRRRW